MIQEQLFYKGHNFTYSPCFLCIWSVGLGCSGIIREKKIIQLKLEKRDLVLAGKSTSKIDEEIDNIKNELDKLSVVK